MTVGGGGETVVTSYDSGGGKTVVTSYDSGGGRLW